MNAPAVLIDIVHETRYDYAAPVALAQHLAHLRPRDDPWQRLLQHSIVIDPAPQHRHERQDALGNACQLFALRVPHQSLRVRACSRVAVKPRFEGLDVDASPPWEQLCAQLRYVARAPYEPAVEFVQPSPRVPRLGALLDYARPSFTPGRPAAQAALDLMRRVHADFAYSADATEVDTPVEQALAQRSGVCQDFAHLMIGALRMTGLPARYVSGYVRPLSSADGQAFVGAQASHAWVQVWVPGTPGVPAGWLSLDPTNNCVPAVDHVRLAFGRDYGDVAPLRGVIRGGGAHTLAVEVRLTPAPAPSAAALSA